LNTAAPFVSGGNRDTADGAFALFNNTTGSSNTAIGDRALINNTTGSNNIALGDSAGSGVTTANNAICIGAAGANSNGCYIGQIFGASLSGGANVFINGNNKLGTIPSSRRFKEEIKPMERTSEVLFALTPVTFRYKKEIDPAGTAQFGLVAEEVEKVNPDLVVRDAESKVYSVRYDAVNAMLLNEFLKAHRKVEKQESRIQEQQASIARLKSTVSRQEATATQQQKQIEALTNGLQKVSAQLGASKPAPHVVNNP